MKRNLMFVLLATAIAATQMGCGKTEDKAAGTPATSPEKAADKGAEKPAEAAPKEAPKAASLALGDFLSKLAPATCNGLDQCKNEKIKALAATMGMMIAGFGTIDKPELGKQVQAVGDAMKKDQRALPNKQECETIGGIVVQLTGMTADAVQAKVGKTVQYDGEKAAACLKALDFALPACATEVKLTGEPKMSELDGFEKEFGPQMDTHLKPCEEALSGMVEVGQACEQDFECKGEGSKCKGAAGDKKCQAGKEKK